MVTRMQKPIIDALKIKKELKHNAKEDHLATKEDYRKGRKDAELQNNQETSNKKPLYLFSSIFQIYLSNPKLLICNKGSISKCKELSHSQQISAEGMFAYSKAIFTFFFTNSHNFISNVSCFPPSFASDRFKGGPPTQFWPLRYEKSAGDSGIGFFAHKKKRCTRKKDAAFYC